MKRTVRDDVRRDVRGSADAGSRAPGEQHAGSNSFAAELAARAARAEGKLSGNDRRVLEFLFSHPEEVAFLTTESAAQGAGVSKAAIVRFCQRTGYAGFAELRQHARREMTGGHDQDAVAAESSQDDVLARKVRRDVAGLQLLPTLLGGSLRSAAQRAARAERLLILANRETHGLAVYFYRLLHHIHDGASLVDPSFPDTIRTLSAKDMLVALTFRPYARDTVHRLPDARAAGAGIVLVTDARVNRFIEPTDHVLVVPVESSTIFLSFVPALAVLETFAAHVARADPDRTVRTLELTDEMSTRHRLMMEPPGAERRTHEP